MMACENGHLQVVAGLIQHGARVELPDKVWLFYFYVLSLLPVWDS